jgi:hypothetical protein
MIKIKKYIKDFETIINIIGKISHETDYYFTTDGIKIRAVDESGTYLGLFNIEKSMFDNYEIEKNNMITLDNNLFKKLIKKVGKKELEISFIEDSIVLSNPKERFELKYFVGQIDDRPEPNIECKSIWNIKTNEFSKIISELYTLGELCCFKSNEKFKIKIKANMIKGEVITKAEKIKSEDCYCYYDLTFIETFIDIKNLFDNIRIGFSDDNPCIIKGNNDYLDFKFIAAARVE